MHESTIDRPKRDPFETLGVVLTAATRYDLLLVIVPVAFAVALVVASVSTVTLPQALLGAALVGALVLVDACYLNPPTDHGSA